VSSLVLLCWCLLWWPAWMKLLLLCCTTYNKSISDSIYTSKYVENIYTGQFLWKHAMAQTKTDKMSGSISPTRFWPFALLPWPAVGSLQGSPQPRRFLWCGAAQGHGPNCSWDALSYAKSGTTTTLHKTSQLQLSLNPRMLVEQRWGLTRVICWWPI